MRYFFRKDQRLNKEADITPIFRSGRATFSFPIKCIYKLVPADPPDGPPCRVLIVSGKSYLKRAHKRNSAKRRMREAYRLNIHTIVPPAGHRLHMALLYVGRNVRPYAEIENSIKMILRDIASQMG
ncbi:MAG: ribonuclease P protein component [Bacteroidales bacterium]|nr:ribonuclease P protein component [Bacteroidales bacterium]